MTEKKLSLYPDRESVAVLQPWVEDTLREELIPENVVIKMNIVTDEIYSNIIFYSQAKMAEVTLSVNESRVSMNFTDDGIPFNPLDAKDPDISLDIEDRGIGGLGIFLTKKLMDEVRYEYKDGKNHLSVVKKI